MSELLGDILRIGLSPSGFSVVRGRGMWRKRYEMLVASSAPQPLSVDTAIEQLRCMLHTLPPQRIPCHVVLADAWARLWMVNLPVNARRLADGEAVAEARFSSLFGEPMNGWSLHLDWHWQKTALACAVPESLLTAVQALAREQQMPLMSVQPQFVAAWNGCRKKISPHGWLGVIHENTMCCAVLGAQGVLAVRTVQLPNDVLHDQQRLLPLLRLEAIRWNVDVPGMMYFCGEVPENWMWGEVS